MASVTITATKICSGGGHAHISVTGADTMEMDVATIPFLDPVTDVEALAFVKVICKLAKAGRTFAQTASILQAGVTVTI